MAAAIKALLVGNYLEDSQHSMLGFGRALVDGLPGYSVDVDFIAPRRILRPPHRWPVKWFGYADKYVFFPRTLRRAAKRADVVHLLDQGNGIYVNHLQGVPHMVTCHDLLAIRSALGELPYWKTGGLGRMYQKAILRGLRRAAFVACVSHATLADAERLLKLPVSRLALVPNGLFGKWVRCAGVPVPKVCRDAGLDGSQPFALNLGSSSAYKNRTGAIDLFAALTGLGGPNQIVLAGRSLSADERTRADAETSPAAIIELANPPREALEWLYSNAWALLVTSHDEGFCLPILEGQACGCPVIIPARAPMDEVAGGGAIAIDPSDPAGAASTIIESMAGASALRNRGYNNVRKYSLEAMVSSYAGLYGTLGSSR